MIIERVELQVAEGKEEAFATILGDARKILSSADGCRSVVAARGVENPSKFLLLLEWDSVGHHVAFTSTAGFGEFRALIGPSLDGRPAMEHFDSF